MSLAFYLAEAFKKHQLGTLIGEETGGNQKGINGGQILFLRLPYSKIEIDVPIVGTFSRAPTVSDGGILPDIQVEYSIDDLIHQRDPQLETVLRIIKGKQDP